MELFTKDLATLQEQLDILYTWIRQQNKGAELVLPESVLKYDKRMNCQATLMLSMETEDLLNL